MDKTSYYSNSENKGTFKITFWWIKTNNSLYNVRDTSEKSTYIILKYILILL